MGKEREDKPLTDEELEAQHTEEIPERAAMSALGLPVDERPELPRAASSTDANKAVPAV